MLAATAITGATAILAFQISLLLIFTQYFRNLANFLPLDAIKYSTCDRGINGRNDSKMFF